MLLASLLMMNECLREGEIQSILFRQPPLKPASAESALLYCEKWLARQKMTRLAYLPASSIVDSWPNAIQIEMSNRNRQSSLLLRQRSNRHTYSQNTSPSSSAISASSKHEAMPVPSVPTPGQVDFLNHAITLRKGLSSQKRRVALHRILPLP